MISTNMMALLRIASRSVGPPFDGVLTETSDVEAGLTGIDWTEITIETEEPQEAADVEAGLTGITWEEVV